MPRSRRFAGLQARSLRLEPLESRRMLSATIGLLTDVGTPDPGHSSPTGFVAVGDLTVFSASRGASARELWITNNQPNGTKLLSEFLPGNLLILGSDYNSVAGTLYFIAKESAVANYRLWSWSVANESPQPVLSATGDRILSLTPMVDVNGVNFFAGQSGSEGPELWRTDGTQGGTYRVKEIRPGSLGGLQPPPNAHYQSTLFNVGGTLMFFANDGSKGTELWKSDGTEAGTVMVKDLRTGGPSGVVFASYKGQQAAVVGQTLYFSGIDQSTNAELWRSDGTEAGTFQVKEIRTGTGGSYPQHLINVGGTLYFNANDGVVGPELWKSDGTEAGTVRMTNTSGSPTAYEATGPFDLTDANGLLYFSVATYLWRTDGTEAGTYRVPGHPTFQGTVALELPGNYGPSVATIDNIVNLNGTLYFAGRANHEGLWKIDPGTAYPTRVLSNASPGVEAASTFDTIYYLTVIGDKLFFSGKSPNHGFEPWISDGTSAGTKLLKDITGVDQGSGVGGLTNADGKLLFYANTELTKNPPPRGWWTTDGTIAGTTSYASLPSASNSVSVLGVANGLLFYKAQGTASTDFELWRTDGTAAGTFRVKDIRPGDEGGLSASFTRAIDAGGVLYFSANDGVHGFELWRSDGTEAGTFMIADLLPGVDDGVASIKLNTMANVNGELYFTASAGVDDFGLWKSDGIAAGTSLVKNFDNWRPQNLYNGNGKLYFGAGNDQSGAELWSSDGTEAGTTTVKDIGPGSSIFLTGDSPGFANIGDTIFFVADDGATGRELWKSDGTEAGTSIVKDIHPSDGSMASSYRIPHFTVIGGTLFFYANDGVHGLELWKSDGTEEGTNLVKDIRVGSSSSYVGTNPYPYAATNNSAINVGGILYFGANNGTHGIELWRSDGTEAGTYMVQDLFAGANGSIPSLLTNVNGRLYFNAFDGVHGNELRVLSPDAAAIAAGDFDENSIVDGNDFLKWQRAFGSSDVGSDGDGDGVVGASDLGVWKENFGAPESLPPVGSVSQVAALVADEEDAADAEFAAANLNGAMDDAAEPGQRARDALFAAGDFSRLFGLGGDGEFENSLRRWGRAPLARRG
ncbi:MAG: hypothetical protein C0485_14660 [Pirellula sp.]|nr:hypothetical protein [Pirellula sp.]